LLTVGTILGYRMIRCMVSPAGATCFAVQEATRFSVRRQYALAAGAEVIATARAGAEAEFVRRFGATHVVDYSGDLGAQVRAIAPDGVPAIAHLAGDAGQLVDLLAAGGRMASTLGFGAEQHPGAVAVMANPDAATLDRLAADAAGGVLHVPITRTYALEETSQALADFAAGSLGKLAITF
jgi:NADPH:quinone reductase-like Zn-dependent oxidoreductase